MSDFSWVEFVFGTATGMTFCWGGVTIIIAAVIAWHVKNGPDADSTDG